MNFDVERQIIRYQHFLGKAGPDPPQTLGQVIRAPVATAFLKRRHELGIPLDGTSHQ